MMHEVIIPKTGLNMNDVHFLRWLAEEGSVVSAGQPLFRMETEKIEVEIEAEETGWLHRAVAAGTDHAVGAVIGFIADSVDAYHDLVGAA